MGWNLKDKPSTNTPSGARDERRNSSSAKDSGDAADSLQSSSLQSASAQPPISKEEDKEGQDWGLPSEFDGYQTKACIGKGAIGKVYRAYDPALDRSLAIKIISAPGDATWYNPERFLVEARAAARIHHPNVVSIYRIGEVLGRPYMATELVTGDRIDEIKRPVSTERALRIGVGLARGLAAAFRVGVLHRDVKPGNVIVTAGSEVKILDFGLAKLMEGADPSVFLAFESVPRVSSKPILPGAPLSEKQLEETLELRQTVPSDKLITTQTQISDLFGTPGYVAPEVWNGEGATFRSDVYSAGAVLYRLCTGKPPYEGRTLEELRDAALRHQVVPILERCELEPRFAAVIMRCLNRDPGLRYANADQLRESLERLMPEHRDVALPEGNPYRGLLAFEAEHRGLFFGRDAEIRAILDRLGSASLVVIAGPSGVGKSSVVLAGVAPRVSDGTLDERRWTVVRLTPGKRPILALANALAEFLDKDEETLARLIEQEPQEVYRQLRKQVKATGPLLIVIDQLEEVVTLAGETDRNVMARFLEALASPCQSLKALATVRLDFVERVEDVADLEEPIRRGKYRLKPMTAENVRQAIEGPAKAKGLTFESPALVQELVNSTAHNEAALPLLEFALAELWDARDVSRNIIPGSALEAIGGVAGALARHADGVLATLHSGQRTVARQMLAQLVTLEGTRTRQTDRELGAEALDRKEALAALVQGRLLTAGESPEGPTYEVSHEALIKSWPTLKRWLEEDAEKRKLHAQLAVDIPKWERLGKREGLWGSRQLAEASLLTSEELLPREKSFLQASHRALRFKRRLAIGIVVGTLALVATVAFGIKLKEKNDRAAEKKAVVEERIHNANSILDHKDRLLKQAKEMRGKAVWLFNNERLEEGKALWADAQRLIGESRRRKRAEGEEATDAKSAKSKEESKAEQASVTVKRLYQQATSWLEGAVDVGQDSKEGKEAWARLADLLYERAVFLYEEGEQVDEEILDRLWRHDTDGSRRRRWEARGKIDIDVKPAATQVNVQKYSVDKSERYVLTSLDLHLLTPVYGLELPLGSYLFTFTSPERTVVRLPMLVEKGRSQRASFEIPPGTHLSPGYIFIPPGGRFLFGSVSNDSKDSVPLHEVTILKGFVIAKNETTWRDWLEYLSSFDGKERVQRAAGFGEGNNYVSIKPVGRDWLLRILVGGVHHALRLGDSFSIPGRATRQNQNWRRLPVVGASVIETEKYLKWLDTSGRLKGARLCTEHEWEYAARGVDGREYPHGDSLAADDANFKQTYGGRRTTWGPDEVGTHPASRSPFGLDDMAGNAWEYTQSSFHSREYVLRGGDFTFVRSGILSSSREVVPQNYKNNSVGFRVCADSPIAQGL